jgi:predicted membrane channel-forming protein YqfA (hemolysin III family)
MGIFYLGGLVIYTTRIPERFKPGLFDIWVFKNFIK